MAHYQWMQVFEVDVEPWGFMPDRGCGVRDRCLQCDLPMCFLDLPLAERRKVRTPQGAKVSDRNIYGMGKRTMTARVGG